MSFLDDIKPYFQTGDYPTQTQFYEFFSKIRWNDQGIAISSVTNLQNILNAMNAAIGGGGGGGTGAAIFTGAGVPSDALGIDGDIYIDTVAPNNLYKKVAGAFVFQAALQGATGADGGGTAIVIQHHTAGATVTIDDDTTWLIVEPAATIPALQITLPEFPTDGQTVEISFGGDVFTIAVTSLVMSCVAGQTIRRPVVPSVIESGEKIAFTYDAADSIWFGSFITNSEIKDVAITALLTGFVAAPGTVTAADTLLEAVQKLTANAAASDIIINQKILSIAGNYSQSII